MNFYESMKRYMQRKKYQKLETFSWRRRRSLRSFKMGSRKMKSFRVKLSPKLKLRWFNPKIMLVKLRDAYVNMMLNVANSRILSSETLYPNCNPFGERFSKEYDKKMLIEIYKSLIIQSQGQIRQLQA
ncbi:hypothetical protein SUGI_0111350 [Cryptomeria japonica]|nr:hypothetical protein SUGI_0111350 [Cryptomeria japonica]